MDDIIPISDEHLAEVYMAASMSPDNRGCRLILALRARLAAAEAALQSIANNSCCGPCQEAKLVAAAAIKARQT